jgi:hypothetical protein
MTRKKVKATMTRKILMRMKNSLWGLHQGGKAVEGKGVILLRVKIFLTTRHNSQRKSTTRGERKKSMNLQRRLLVRYS